MFQNVSQVTEECVSWSLSWLWMIEYIGSLTLLSSAKECHAKPHNWGSGQNSESEV